MWHTTRSRQAGSSELYEMREARDGAPGMPALQGQGRVVRRIVRGGAYRRR